MGREVIRIYEGMAMPAVALASRNYTSQIERDIFDPYIDVAFFKSPTILDYSFLRELPSQTAFLNRIGFLNLRSLAFEQLALEEQKIAANTLHGFKNILESLPHFPSLGTVRVMRICRTRKRRIVSRRLDTGVWWRPNLVMSKSGTAKVVAAVVENLQQEISKHPSWVPPKIVFMSYSAKLPSSGISI